MFTVKSLVWLRWPCALVWFYWFDWVKRCRVWFSWVSVLYARVDSGSSRSCMSWLNVLTRLAKCLSWPSALLWLCWPVVWHDWVDLNILTNYVAWLGWPGLLDKVLCVIGLTWRCWQGWRQCRAPPFPWSTTHHGGKPLSRQTKRVTPML